jgi:hypothetical protein
VRSYVPVLHALKESIFFCKLHDHKQGAFGDTRTGVGEERALLKFYSSMDNTRTHLCKEKYFVLGEYI